MNINESIDHIWLYSKYYGELVASSFRLNEEQEHYAAILLLFNTLELVVKSIRENDSNNLVDDFLWLLENDYITNDEYNFLNDKNYGIRGIRNTMMHKDLYEYCIELNDKAYMFADSGTWGKIFDLVAYKIVRILSQIILKKQKF